MVKKIVGCEDAYGILYKECERCEYHRDLSKCQPFRVKREFHFLWREKED